MRTRALQLLLISLTGILSLLGTGAAEPAEVPGHHQRTPLVIAGDGSGFVIVNDKKKYDMGVWLLLDCDKDWDKPEAVVWKWDPQTEPDIKDEHRKWFVGSRDGRCVKNGTQVLVCASNGGIALIDVCPKKTVLYTNVGINANPHSIDILPDGNIVTASSFKNKVSVISVDATASTFPEKPKINEVDLNGAHGVVWDNHRKLLWALGDKLNVYEYKGDTADPQLSFIKSIDPPEASGHDLYLTPDGKALFVTTNGWAGFFNPDTGAFTEHPQLGKKGGVKVISQNETAGTTA